MNFNMKRFIPIIPFTILFVVASFAQEVKVIKYPELLTMMEEDHSDKLIIYNFWATWCAPCVKEMPHFDKANSEDNVKVKFVSFDDINKMEDRVIPFLKRKGIQSEVFLLDETDYNEFIDKIDKRWSGAIPATIVFNNNTGEKLFFEKEFSEDELKTLIRNQLN